LGIEEGRVDLLLEVAWDRDVVRDAVAMLLLEIHREATCSVHLWWILDERD